MMVIVENNGVIGNETYPADRCTWETDTAYTGDGYRIRNARFYNGVTAPTLPANAINQPVLGYIGKSGRFFAITATH